MAKRISRIKIKFLRGRTVVEAHSQSPRGSSYLAQSGTFITDDPRDLETKGLIAAAVKNMMEPDEGSR